MGKRPFLGSCSTSRTNIGGDSIHGRPWHRGSQMHSSYAITRQVTQKWALGAEGPSANFRESMHAPVSSFVGRSGREKPMIVCKLKIFRRQPRFYRQLSLIGQSS